MAACPRCGGVERRALAPNFFECETRVLVFVVPRGVQGNPTDVPLYEACGHQYQEGAPTAPRCSCGVFAIGECNKCSKPLCGLHGGQYSKGFLCTEHGLEGEHEKRGTRRSGARSSLRAVGTLGAGALGGAGSCHGGERRAVSSSAGLSDCHRYRP